MEYSELLSRVDDHNGSFSGLSASSAITGSSSSKAVLAALRALQDKIRRLETERSQALDESSQLRLQIKNQEIEWEHVKQREQIASQKSIQDSKISNEKLLQEKNELEVKLIKLEEKNHLLTNSSDELQLKIRLLEEEKHTSALKIKELEHNQLKVEQQINVTQFKEKEMAQSLVWENKRHDEEMSSLQMRLNKTQEDLHSFTVEKNSLELKINDLDQLVSQLLALNESLVSQLSGRPSKVKTSSSTTKKKSSSTGVSVVKKSGTKASKDVSSVAKAVLANSLKTDNVEQLKAMHKMYATMAKSMIQSSPSRKKSVVGSGLASSSGSRHTSPAKSRDTRMSRKKSAALQDSVSKVSSSLDDLALSTMSNHLAHQHLHHSHSTPRSSSREVRIPKPAVTFDQSYDSDSVLNRSIRSVDREEVASTRRDFEDYLASRRDVASTPTSSTPNKSDLQDMISSLESEFDALNRQYRTLLHNVSASSSVVPPSTSAESIQQQAEDIVNVIQKLHEKGEQLRQLKSPLK